MKEIRTICSLQHPLVKHWVKLRNNKHYRQQQSTILLEGFKPICEVSNHVINVIYTTSYASEVAPLLSLEGRQGYEITDNILQKIAGTASPEGILAEVKMPVWGTLNSQTTQLLALDAVNDPGNLGTLMRTALAFGWHTIYLLPDTCDPFNEKTLRAARGAHFKLCLIKGSVEQLSLWTQQYNVQSLMADIKGTCLEAIPHSAYRLLVLGNEAHGVHEKVAQFCKPVTIPMRATMESLNVAIAGGILLYFLGQRSDI